VADPKPGPDPDGSLRQRVAAEEAALIASYRKALATHPELADDLRPFLAHHEAHLARISPGSLPEPASPGSTLGTSTSPPSAAKPSASKVPGSGPSPGTSTPTTQPSTTATLRRLAEAERKAQRARVRDCDAASSPTLARDLCLVAASEAQHEAVLRDLTTEASRP
jgi:hypothetical protein